MIKDSQGFDIYLASRSPRRQELLLQIGVDFRLIDIEIPEVPDENESAESFVQRMAIKKAEAGLKQLKKNDVHSVLGADTAVVIDDEILGKPAGRDDAIRVLRRLSNREHQVFSAVALVNAENHAVRLNRSRVSFRAITDEEILAYWASGECEDKAGAYAIQGRAAVFINHLNGSYSGVMGLPLYETSELLQLFHIFPVE